MTAAADSHLESGPDTPVVGPQLHHQATLHAAPHVPVPTQLESKVGCTCYAVHILDSATSVANTPTSATPAPTIEPILESDVPSPLMYPSCSYLDLSSTCSPKKPLLVPDT
jgi:hypothetical protein